VRSVTAAALVCVAAAAAAAAVGTIITTATLLRSLPSFHYHLLLLHLPFLLALPPSLPPSLLLLELVGIEGGKEDMGEVF